MAAAALAGLSSCSEKENVTTPEVPSEGIPFEVSTVITKTANDGMATRWAESDAINIYHAEADATAYVSDGQFTVDAALAGNFTGKLASALEDGKTYDWYANYPYTAQKTSPAAGTTGALTIGGLTQTQTGNSSTAHLCGQSCPLYGVVKGVAASDKPSLTMKNLASVLAVKVRNASSSELTVTKVEFTSTEDIVGTYYIDYTGKAPVYTAADANSTATLAVTGAEAIAKDGEATFYLAIKPHTVKIGSTLVVAVNGQKQNFTLTADATFNAGKFKTLSYSYVDVVPTFECKFESATTKTSGANAWTLEAAGSSVKPEYVAGKVGNAVKLKDGAYFNVRDFVPSAIAGTAVSVAVWVNPSKTYANNYVVSFNKWDSWKLNIQESGMPLFSLTSTGKGTVDMDNSRSNSCPAGEWHHVAVCADIAAGTVVFYIDGAVSCTYTEKAGGTIKYQEAVSDNHLAIGNVLEGETNDNYFYGLLDELKVYNVALTAEQVSRIYNLENK